MLTEVGASVYVQLLKMSPEGCKSIVKGVWCLNEALQFWWVVLRPVFLFVVCSRFEMWIAGMGNGITFSKTGGLSLQVWAQ